MHSLDIRSQRYLDVGKTSSEMSVLEESLLEQGDVSKPASWSAWCRGQLSPEEFIVPIPYCDFLEEYCPLILRSKGNLD